jgi:hypothetical protein
MRVNAFKAGLVFGLFLALWHALWSALVAAHLAQSLVDFVLWAHFINLPIQIASFEMGRALILIGVTFLVGLVGGWMLALVWNAFHSAED